eukprot:364268-Chlamydomonas_euryale.AAC.8
MSASTTGSANASVLPEPVLARPMRSRPSLMGSYTAFWMGKSAWMPRFLSWLTVASHSPRLSTCERINAYALRESGAGQRGGADPGSKPKPAKPAARRLRAACVHTHGCIAWGQRSVLLRLHPGLCTRVAELAGANGG